jgi:hypothetical protein
VRLELRAEQFCRRMLRSESLRFQAFWPAGTIALLAGISVIPAISRDMPIREGKECPTAALDWIEAHHLNGNFFAPPDYGSYITWRLGARARSYVDTRGFFFPPELLEDSHYLPQLDSLWRRRLERVIAFGTDYFLLETTGARGRLWESLHDHGAEALYCDDETVLVSASQVQKLLAEPTESARTSSVEVVRR